MARLRTPKNWRIACWNGGDWRGSNSAENCFKITAAQTDLDAADRDSKGLALLLFSLISWSLFRFVPWNRWLRPATLPFWMARRDCRRYSFRALRALWLLSSSAALERRTGRNKREERFRNTSSHLLLTELLSAFIPIWADFENV